MSALVDPRPHATAIKSAIAAALGSAHVYDHAELPGGYNDPDGTLPNIFVLVAIERRQSEVLRSARAGNAGWRIVLTVLGRTVKECDWARLKVAEALGEQRLEVSGFWTTPIQFESDTAPRFDNGRFAADALYTYAH